MSKNAVDTGGDRVTRLPLTQRSICKYFDCSYFIGYVE